MSIEKDWSNIRLIASEETESPARSLERLLVDLRQRVIALETSGMPRIIDDPPMSILRAVQKAMVPWQQHNFPNRPAWQPLLGIGEELGELNHAFLKDAQGIRTGEVHRDAIEDAIGDILIFLCDFANAMNLSVESCLALAWAEVKDRDWQKYPGKGKPE